VLLIIWAVIASFTGKKTPTPPPAAAPVIKPPDLIVQRKLEKEHALRLDASAQIEDVLVQGGYDVQVVLMTDNDRHIVVVGAPVDRLFVRQFAASGIRRRLKERGIDEVTFMKDRFSWVAEWDVFYNKLEALP